MEGLGTFLLFAIIFYLMMRYGCGAHMMHGHGGHEKHKDSEKKHFTDPVCDMKVEADKGYGMMHQGEPYRFCTRSCLEKFDANPERYLNKQPGENHEM